MSYFAKSVGSPDSSQAVRQSMIEASNHYLGLNNPNAKVFFIKAKSHIQTKKDIGSCVSEGVSLLDWLNGMFFDGVWRNIRPDLSASP